MVHLRGTAHHEALFSLDEEMAVCTETALVSLDYFISLTNSLQNYDVAVQISAVVSHNDMNDHHMFPF